MHVSDDDKIIRSSQIHETDLMENVYLFLASDHSLLTHVNNTAGDVVVELPRRYRLDGSWECAISEITFVSEFEQLTDRIYVCADMIDDSYVRRTTLPILRSIDHCLFLKSKTSIEPIFGKNEGCNINDRI
jgi:hypothetical protein